MSGRVLFAVTELGLGGAEVQVVELARALKERGWTVAVLSMCRPVDLMDRLAEADIPLSTLNLARGQITPLMFVRMFHEVRRFRPDVLHTHTRPANLLGRMVRPFTRPPVVITSAHNVNEGGALWMALYRITDRQADLTTNVSRRAVERYVRIGAVPAGRIRCMPNGVDLTRFQPDADVRKRMRGSLGLAEDEFLWLAVGRLRAQKDYSILVDAVTRLGGGQVRVLIAGSGDDEARLRSKISTARARVELLGVRHDIPELMQAADGYVMSSAWEGLPVVLLEAAASGLPIVATDVGGNAEIVQQGLTGFLVPAGDPAALAEAMAKVVDTPVERRREMGRTAREAVSESYGMAAVVDRWEQTYRDLLAGRRGHDRGLPVPGRS